MEHAMQTMMRITLLVLALVPWGTESALAQAYPPPGSGPPPASSPPLASNPPSQSGQYSSNEVIDAGHRFFGTISHGLAEIVEKAGSQWGLPNGYVLGQEAGGAWVAGLRYGEGMLYTKNAGDRQVYWQGPSLGFDFGGDGARTMMPVYDLPATDAIYQRFVGIEGSAYFVGGLGMTALSFKYRRRPRSFWRRITSRRQRWIFEIHPHLDLESVLSRTRTLQSSASCGKVSTGSCA